MIRGSTVNAISPRTRRFRTKEFHVHHDERVGSMTGPRLQIALDTQTLPDALGPLQKAADHIDVIEVGTVLVYAEGMHAVRAIRALFPDKTILADCRIAEAGSLLSRIAFEAGADWVSVVAGASLTTISQVCRVAKEFGGQVQVELGETYDRAVAQTWRDLGVDHVIVKRSRDAEAAGSLTWGEDDFQRVQELSEIGFTVTVTGGVSASDLEAFTGLPVGVVIAGRAIVAAEDPSAAAAELQSAIARVWK